MFHSHHPLQFYVPWLIALPVIAAAGASLVAPPGGDPAGGRPGGDVPGDRGARADPIVATPLDILVDVVIQRGHTVEHTFCGTAWALVSFVLAPGLALALGLLAAAVWRHHAPRAGVEGWPVGSRPSVKA